MQFEIKTKDEGREHIREIWISEEDKVCRLAVIDYRMRIGTEEVRMAGIGGVHTEYRHRMKGYMRHLLEDTVHYMMDEGYDVSMLFGIENFYTKFGYASSLASYICKVKTRDAEVAKAQARTYVTRPIGADDMPAVLGLYNAKNAARTCSIIRTHEDFAEFPMGTWYGTPPETMLWEDDGTLLAYATWDKYDKAVKVAEVVARDDADALFPALLYAFAEQAIAKRCEDIQLFMPPDHPFAEFVQRYGAEWAVTYPRNGSGMMRILNQRSLFEKIALLLEQRLITTPLAGYTGAFDLRTDLGITTFTFKEGKLTAGAAESPAFIALSQDKLMQLVVGYRSVRDVANDPDVQVKGEILPLLAALFPKGYAYPWSADHF